MRTDDFIITAAYFSIPIQLLVSLYKYPRLAAMPWHISVMLVLFALFIFLCGTGHLMRCLNRTDDVFFVILNTMTAFISLTTALYLLPLVPNLMSTLDQGLQDLKDLNKKEKESKRKLKTFMAFLCHEIRNPLFAITSTITFLGDDELTPDQDTALNSISQSANLMLRLVNDVLDINKLESGILEIEHHVFDLPTMLEGVATSMRTQVQLKHKGAVNFTFDITSSVPQIICSDSVRLLQIAYNLLSNAAKFTERGTVDFRISTMNYDIALRDALILDPREAYLSDTSTGGSGGEFSVRLLRSTEEGLVGIVPNTHENTCVLKIQVTDTGQGIPSQRLERIFKPYEQSKLSDYRQHGGTGLGLSIISKLIKIMGGTIHVTSKEHIGSTFVVFIPVQVSEQHNPSLEVDPLAALHDNLNPRLPDLERIEFDAGCTSRTAPLLQTATPSNPPSMVVMDTPQKQTTSRSLSKKLSARKILPKFDFPPNESVVLVVDDNGVNRKMLGRMLSHYNMTYAQACDGQEAVDYMLKSRNYTRDPNAPQVGLVFMDLSMPVMDGCEAMSAIRARGLKLPIIALTANALEEGRQKALEAGATEFKTKPILRDDLHARCTHYLKPRAVSPLPNGTKSGPDSSGERSELLLV